MRFIAIDDLFGVVWHDTLVRIMEMQIPSEVERFRISRINVKYMSDRVPTTGSLRVVLDNHFMKQSSYYWRTDIQPKVPFKISVYDGDPTRKESWVEVISFSKCYASGLWSHLSDDTCISDLSFYGVSPDAETLLNFFRSLKKEPQIRCPSCGSGEVGEVNAHRLSLRCNRCGYYIAEKVETI